jgi:hypothetical protein
MRKVTPLEIL